MIIYMAGESGGSTREKMWLALIDHRLLSYWFIKEYIHKPNNTFELVKNENLLCRRAVKQ